MTTIVIRGTSLFVRVLGQGYPLVLMHGGHNPQMENTAEVVRIISGFVASTGVAETPLATRQG